MTDHDQTKESELVLGWRMNTRQEPRYWVATSHPAAGGQSPDDMVTIPSRLIGFHTSIIAQSGSGKSFFLGRLLEEILVQTKARCIVFDPNADFRKASEIADKSLWESATYDRHTGRGKLPHEVSRAEFEKQWSPVRELTRIRGSNLSVDCYEPLQLRWSSLSVEFLGEEIDPMLRSDLYHCHTFAQDVEILFRVVGYAKAVSPDDSMFETEKIFSETEKIFQEAREGKSDFRAKFEKEFDIDSLIGSLFEGPPSVLFKEDSGLVNVMRLFGFTVPSIIEPVSTEFLAKLGKTYKELLHSLMRSHLERILQAPKYVSKSVQHFYFSKAREYQIAGILEEKITHRELKPPIENRLEVVDLPSLKNRTTILLAINAILSMEWERARRDWSKALEKSPGQDDRKPTFIVVDEAHNLIPDKPRGKAEEALLEQFRTIVAEGRKYGLYLILVSQRPDKLDPLVLSECENKALMKLSSASVLKITKQMLGLDDVHPKLLNKTLDFEASRVLLTGRWAQDNPQLLYCAARRTVEGGRNLRDEYWAAPYESLSPTAGSRAPDLQKESPAHPGTTGE
ncbi:MAG TPA: DUF87 domain-containing protein [Pyrinomonadaceae bacterium]|jgi:hypothetical protein|nr:DUF87 domain-containing protein [Pyrinomonadaceae bacterium]